MRGTDWQLQFGLPLWNYNVRYPLIWCPNKDTCLSPLVISENQHWACVNTLRLRYNDRYFPDGIFKRIFLNGNVLISIKISLKFVPMGPINNIPALVQIMAWRRPGDKPLSEPMMVTLLMHTCVPLPQWVKVWNKIFDRKLLICCCLLPWISVMCLV